MHPKIISLSKNQVYWLLHVAGWMSIVFVETINYTFFILREFNWNYVLQFTMMSIVGMLVSHFYKRYFIKPKLFEQNLSRIWIRALTDTIIIATVMDVITTLPSFIAVPEYYLGNTKEALIGFVGQIMNFSRYVVVWIIIYYLYKVMGKNREILAQKLQAEHTATITELELLKTQLNPHFLFNALNSIKALVNIDAEKAREAIIKLSEILRFSLNYEKHKLINLDQELMEVKKYLELEKIRFGERLSFYITAPPTTLHQLIPPAIILTLSENAIKHGISKLPTGGNIRIEAASDGKEMIVSIINSGSIQVANPKGIGLKNVNKRLHNIYGKEATFELREINAAEILAQIKIPIIK